MTAVQRDSAPLIDDEQLVARARCGDREAAAELIERSREALLRFCYRYLGNVHEAEDAAQDVLAKVTVCGHWPEGGFRAWLFRVARNRCLDLLKRRKDGRVGAGSAMNGSRIRSPRTGPRTALLREERHDRLRDTVAGMPEPHREVLMLRYFDDLNRREIAEVLELSESVVKSRLCEARWVLRERMQETWG